MNDLPYPPNEHAIISLTHMALSINPSLDPLTARNIAQAYLAAVFYPNRFARGDELIAQFKRLKEDLSND